MLGKFEDSYKVIEKILKSAPEDSIIHQIDLRVFVHGSLLSNTTVRPIHKDEIDLDIVILFKLDHQTVNPQAVQDEIYNLLAADERYKKIIERKSRCIRIQYKSNFHIDLMPALPEFQSSHSNWIMVPHEVTEGNFTWQLSNPMDLNEWLKGREQRFDSLILNEDGIKRGDVEVVPMPDQTVEKSNLLYIIQLLKRSRDHHFKGDEDAKKIARSIALLVLAGTHYQWCGNNLILELISVVDLIEQKTANYLDLHVYNPVQLHLPKEEREDFAEKWRQDKALYDQFREWILHLQQELEMLFTLRASSLTDYAEILKKLFHENCVIDAYNDMGEDLRKAQDTHSLSVTSKGAMAAVAAGTVMVKPARAFGRNFPEFMACEPVKKSLPLFAQMERMRVLFPQFKTKHRNGVVEWTGAVAPWEGGPEYVLRITLKQGYHPNIQVISHDIGEYCKHTYPGKRLCLYHPYDSEERWREDEFIAEKIVPWSVSWLAYWNIWKVTGHWHGDEFPHRSSPEVAS